MPIIRSQASNSDGSNNARVIAEVGGRNSGSSTNDRKAVREEWFYSVFTGTAAADIAVSSGVPAILKKIRNVGTVATIGTLRVSDGTSGATVTNGRTSYPPTAGGTFLIVPAGLAINDEILFEGLVLATSLVIQLSNAADVFEIDWMPR